MTLLLFLSGPAAMAAGGEVVGEENEPVEEVAAASESIVAPTRSARRPERRAIPRPLPTVPAAETARRTISTAVRTPRAPGGFQPPLRC